jgi:hypothetical protein
MTQDEYNRQLHQQVIREFRAMTLEERIQLLIESGILTPDRQLAPQYAPLVEAGPQRTGDEAASS